MTRYIHVVHFTMLIILTSVQLRESIRKRRAFAGFLEQPIQFLPWVPPFSLQTQYPLTAIRVQNVQVWCWPADRFVRIRYKVCPMLICSPAITLICAFYPRRKPAWTDRILHLPSPSISVQQLSYSGHPRIAMSDHRPVSADFAVQASLIAPCL